MIILTIVRILLVTIIICKHYLVEIEDKEKKALDGSEDLEKGGSDYSVFQPQKQCGKCYVCDQKIIGGLEARRHEIPWQVLLTMPCHDDGKLVNTCKEWNGRTNTGVCGGSILTKDAILTAAHCTAKVPNGAEGIIVWTGEHDSSVKDGEKAHTVCQKTEHPGYNRGTAPEFDNDIAILYLCEPLIFSAGKFYQDPAACFCYEKQMLCSDSKSES